MKSKIFKILGVVLTLALLSSFMVATPAAADPGVDTWTEVNMPAIAPNTDVGQVVVAADGTLYAAVCDYDADGDGLSYYYDSDELCQVLLMKSKDGGFTWTATNFVIDNPDDPTGISGDLIADVVIAPDGMIYVGTYNGNLYRVEDGGDGDVILMRSFPSEDYDGDGDDETPQYLFDLDVWNDGDDNWIMAGTDLDVLVLRDNPMFEEWRRQDLNGTAYKVAFAPDFGQSSLIWAITDTGAYADIDWNGDSGYSWDPVGPAGPDDWDVQGSVSDEYGQIDEGAANTLLLNVVGCFENWEELTIINYDLVASGANSYSGYIKFRGDDSNATGTAYIEGTFDDTSGSFDPGEALAILTETDEVSPHTLTFDADAVRDFYQITCTINPGQWGRTIHPVTPVNEVGNAIYDTPFCDIDFPDFYDSDDSPVVFAALTGFMDTGNIVMMEGEPASSVLDSIVVPILDDDVDVMSLVVSGEVILSGATFYPTIFRSENLGDTFDIIGWDPDASEWVGKGPTGDYRTDIAIRPGADLDPDAGIVYASTCGVESAVSRSTDGGVSYNQIGLIDTTLDDIVDLAFSPVTSSQPALMITDDWESMYDTGWGSVYTESLWRTADITATKVQWERVWCTNIAEPWEFLRVAYSEDGSAVMMFVWEDGDSEIWKSTDNAQNFYLWRTLPAAVDMINDWVVLDGATIYAATDEGFMGTARFGPVRLVDVSAVPDLDAMWSIALQPGFDPDDDANDTMLLGSVDGLAYVSLDGGITWGSAVSASSYNTYVAFDAQYATNKTFYASTSSGMDTLKYGVVDGVAPDFVTATMKALKDSQDATLTPTASGMEVSSDNTLYCMSYGVAAGDEAEFPVTVSGEIAVQITGEIFYQEGGDGDGAQIYNLPQIGILNADELPVDHVSGTFLDDELVTSISSVLTVDGIGSRAGYADLANDGDYFTMTADFGGILINYECTADVLVELYDDTTATTSILPNDGSVTLDERDDELIFTATDDDQTVDFDYTPFLSANPFWAGSTIDFYLYTTDGGTWDTYRPNWDVIVSGTIGVKGSYSGATGDIAVDHMHVDMPNYWNQFFFAIWDPDDTTYYSVDLVAFVFNTNLISDVAGPAAEAIPGGVWRLLLHETDTLAINGNIWENLAITGAEGLWVTEGSNFLWTIAPSKKPPKGPVIWVFEDTLTKSVTLSSPTNGAALTATSTATISWSAMIGAYKYEVFYYPSNTPADAIASVAKYVTGVKTTSTVLSGLTSGTDYTWKVRVTDTGTATSNFSMHSRWSASWKFTTALSNVAEILYPYEHALQQSIPTNTVFQWTEVTGATGYKMELADNANFTGATAATTTGAYWDCGKVLDTGKTYYFRVKATKGAVESAGWTVRIFTIEPAPITPTTTIQPTPTLTVSIPPATTINIPAQVTPTITVAPPAVTVNLPTPTTTIVNPVIEMPVEKTPVYIWAIVAIGALLTFAVIILIIRTRRVV